MTKTKVLYLVVVVVFFAVVGLAITMGAGAATPALQPSDVSLPLTPTSGPPPTEIPYQAEGGSPIKNEEEALQRALAIDAKWAKRERPLTEVVADNPDAIIIEQYATRAEAEMIYFGSTSPISEIAAEPVWVVRISGQVSVMSVGGLGVGDRYQENDGVTYVISQKTGFLLGISSSDLPREERIERWRATQPIEEEIPIENTVP